jgi:hypothetical protein
MQEMFPRAQSEMAGSKTESFRRGKITMERQIITVAEAQRIHGSGTQIHWRPEGKINLRHPDKDVAILVNLPDAAVSVRGVRKAVDHIDGDPTNNAPENLRIVTVSENLP